MDVVDGPQATLSGMATATRTVAEVCESAKRAARELVVASTEAKNAALLRLAELLGERVRRRFSRRTRRTWPTSALRA